MTETRDSALASSPATLPSGCVEQNIAANRGGDEGAEVQLLAGFDVYPGSEAVLTNNSMHDGGAGTNAQMQSDDSRQEMTSYYRAQAEAAGMTIGTDEAAGEQWVVSGNRPDGARFTFIASSADGTTSGVLSTGISACLAARLQNI